MTTDTKQLERMVSNTKDKKDKEDILDYISDEQYKKDSKKDTKKKK
jgi:hypothetical protein